jgi:acyl-coenzyme A thioesterase PaaI-like protein
VTTDELIATRAALHRHCVVCGEAPCSLGLAFEIEGERVAAEFSGGAGYQGYDGMLHGGVISAMLDAAMTHCLFARGLRGVTGELNVRFRRPVETDRPVRVSAELTDAREPLYYLRAELRQDGKMMASAKAKFIHQPKDSQGR